MEDINVEGKPCKIRLRFSIRNCSKSYYYSITFNSEELTTPFETEEILVKNDKTDIKFFFHVCCDYYFYRNQNIEINVIKKKTPNYYKNINIKEKFKGLNLSAIISSKNGQFEIVIDDNLFIGKKEILVIKAENDTNIDNNIEINSNTKNTFIDYIISGINLKCFICIDFSEKEYHSLNEEKNQYLLSIKGFRETLYHFTRNFEVFGFGNNLENNNKNIEGDMKYNKNKKFFNLSKDNTEFEGYTSIKYAYFNIFNNLNIIDNLFEEKNLSFLIEYLSQKIIEQDQPFNYNIIFILINSLKEKDFQNCIDIFIKTTNLPLSFVIIGIGNDDKKFDLLKKLCEIKIDNKGNKKIRNNTFFISMKECDNKVKIFKDKCLQKIPEQICEFYFINKIRIKDIKEYSKDHNNKKSLRIFETYNSIFFSQNLFEDKDNNKDNAAPSFNNIINLGEEIMYNNINNESGNNKNINNNINKNKRKNSTAGGKIHLRFGNNSKNKNSSIKKELKQSNENKINNNYNPYK